MHLVGSGTDGGKTVAFDVHYGSNGSDGSITMSGTKIRLVFLTSNVYFKAPDSFLRKQAGASGAGLRAISGKWIEASRTSATGKGFAQLADRTTLINSFASSFSAADAASIKRTRELAGRGYRDRHLFRHRRAWNHRHRVVRNALPHQAGVHGLERRPVDLHPVEPALPGVGSAGGPDGEGSVLSRRQCV